MNKNIWEILLDEVELAPRDMKIDNSGGKDGIVSELIKYAYLKSRRLSKDWNSSDIKLIYRKGNKEDIRNLWYI